MRMIRINTIPVMPSTKSCSMESVSAAEKPINDHRNGITKMYHEGLRVAISKIPKVNIVVGQGRPNVGDAGKVIPDNWFKRG